MRIRVFWGALFALLLIAGRSSAADAPPLIFLITIDTLRADHLPSYGYPRDTAPFISHLGNRGVVFENVRSATSHTGPSLASLLTARLPFEHGLVRNGENIRAAVRTLPDFLRDEGYVSAAFSSVRFLAPLGERFDSFEDSGDPGAFYGFIHAGTVVDKAKEWINRRGSSEKLFVWLHFYDVHQRLGWHYDYTGAIQALKANDRTSAAEREQLWVDTHGVSREYLASQKIELHTLMDDYDGRIRYVDNEVAAFFNEVRRRFPDRSSLWIVTADHGEGLGAHDWLGHGRHLYDEQLRIPLIFYFSDGEPRNRRVPSLARSIDVYPTVAAMFGQTLEGEGVRGVSFLGTIRGGGTPFLEAFAQRRPAEADQIKMGWTKERVFALAGPRYKYIHRSSQNDLLFDLLSDPYERRNIRQREPDLADEMRSRLFHVFDLTIASDQAVPEQPGREAFLEDLRSLGYVQ